MDEVSERFEDVDPFIERALTSPLYKEVLGPTIRAAARSYRIARVLSVVWFTVGVGLLLVAVLFGVARGEGALAFVFGGLGVADLSALLFYRPIERIQSGVDQLIRSQIACVSYVAQYDSVVRTLTAMGKMGLDDTDREEQLRLAGYLRDSTSQLMADLGGCGRRMVKVVPGAGKCGQGEGAADLVDRANVGEKAARKLEEYRIFIEDTARYSDRRQTVSNIYVAVNALLLSAAAVVVGGGSVGGYGWLVLAPLFLVGFLASVVWLALVHRYEGIIEKRVEELREIEKGIPGSHGMYHKMDKAFCGRVPSFSRVEKVLPWVFIVLDLVLLVAVVALGLT